MKISIRNAAALTIIWLAAVPLSASVQAQSPAATEIARWEQQARNITIIRDRWGIAHVYGKTDADAVFGMEYAQAEDDFNRVETNYMTALGRVAEAEGESAIWQDLRARLYADPDSLKAAYASSPESLKKLMNAFADGLNYFLYKHPEVKPRAITRFEPWMALSFTEGSIGGDIERINLRQLQAFYSEMSGTKVGVLAPAQDRVLPGIDVPLPAVGSPPEPQGSNGIAIAGKNTVNGNALLYINPHTSFYFRSELQMTSDEGLNAYGAVTWGQFFIYQGFNERAGWMHTSSGVDNIDTFLETVLKKGNRYVYRHGSDELPVASRPVTVRYATPNGMAERSFTAYFTKHGPIVGREGDKWLSVSLMWSPVNALIQSYTRTKAHNLAEYLKVMELHTNSSNNTLYADADGNIAYLHSNYIPRRDPSFDWTQPVDGSNPATDYHGVLSLDETPNSINPASGWVYNSNNWPWSASGPSSPNRADFPAYVETGRWEMPRGVHALKLLSNRSNFTLASLTEAGYDSWLPSFAAMVPRLIAAYDALPAADARRAALQRPIEVLRAWDYRWSVQSVPTSVAVFWGEDVLRRVGQDARAKDMAGEDFIAQGSASGDVLLQSLSNAVRRLESDFGTWETPWGYINRFQRITPDIDAHFDDTKFSIPVPFTSARWGSLASFGARPYPNTKRWYGTSGNSFIAAVEFGDSVHAHAVTAGGESGHPDSPHFTDQATAYAMGSLREVYYYRDDVEAHQERTYHPGEER
jgi:acyl-homoserine lactone acylase PvdQ